MVVEGGVVGVIGCVGVSALMVVVVVVEGVWVVRWVVVMVFCDEYGIEHNFSAPRTP